MRHQTDEILFGATTKPRHTGWILALSLGKECGFATGYRTAMFAGWSALRDRRFRGGSPEQKLSGTLAVWGEFANRVILIQPKPMHRLPGRKRRPTDTLWQALADLMTAWAQARGMTVELVDIATVKKSFTGFGNASQDKMLDEAQRRSFDPMGYDEVLAVAAFDLALDKEPIHT